MVHSFTVKAKYTDDNHIMHQRLKAGEIERTKVTVPGQLNVYDLHIALNGKNPKESLIPNPSQEISPGANANYSEACLIPKKIYSDVH